MNLTLWDRKQTDLTVGERKSKLPVIINTTSGWVFQFNRKFNDSTTSNYLQSKEKYWLLNSEDF